MSDQLITLILDESKWFTAAMGCAFLAVAVLLYRCRNVPSRRRVLAALNLFFGIVIGVMSSGHFTAVTAKFMMGTLEGALPLLYLIGIVMAVPAWWIVVHTRNILNSDNAHKQMTLVLNGWLGVTLLVLGITNLPLAIPSLINIGYLLHVRPVIGRVIAGVAIAVYTALFVGSLIFLASGQTFEQFRGMN